MYVTPQSGPARLSWLAHVCSAQLGSLIWQRLRQLCLLLQTCGLVGTGGKDLFHTFSFCGCNKSSLWVGGTDEGTSKWMRLLKGQGLKLAQ